MKLRRPQFDKDVFLSGVKSYDLIVAKETRLQIWLAGLSRGQGAKIWQGHKKNSMGFYKPS